MLKRSGCCRPLAHSGNKSACRAMLAARAQPRPQEDTLASVTAKSPLSARDAGQLHALHRGDRTQEGIPLLKRPVPWPDPGNAGPDAGDESLRRVNWSPNASVPPHVRICRIPCVSSSMSGGTGSKIGLKATPIINMTLSDGYGPGERAPTRLTEQQPARYRSR